MDGIKYNIGIVITVHNRPELTRQSFIDLDESDLPEDCVIIIVDDGSEDTGAQMLYERFIFKRESINIFHEKAIGVAKSLREGFDKAVELGCRILVNLDNDVRLKQNWLTTLLDLHQHYPTTIVSGFHSNNPQHKTIQERPNHYVRRSAGGINLLFAANTYRRIVKPVLIDNMWDWNMSKRARTMAVRILVSKPSVVQHTGRNSNLNHEHFDQAEDF